MGRNIKVPSLQTADVVLSQVPDNMIVELSRRPSLLGFQLGPSECLWHDTRAEKKTTMLLLATDIIGAAKLVSVVTFIRG